MKITPDDATRALYEAEAAAERSFVAASYWGSSGKLFVWGAVWVVANVGGMLRMPHGAVAFPALLLLGVLASLWCDLRDSRSGRRFNNLLRSFSLAGGISLFIFGVTAVTGAETLMQIEAVICLSIGAAYSIAGGRLGWRLVAIGLAQMIGTIAAWLYGRDQFFFWMAIVGGAGLILGGVWLRKA